MYGYDTTIQENRWEYKRVYFPGPHSACTAHPTDARPRTEALGCTAHAGDARPE